MFGTTWYYRLDLPGVKEFVAAYQKQFPGMAIRVPGNVYHNGYMATRELLRCVEEAGTTNNIAVIKKLEGRKMSAADRLQHHDAWIDPVTHQCQQTIYMASYNDKPAEKDDIFKILSQVDPKEVVDTGRRRRLQAGELRGHAELRSLTGLRPTPATRAMDWLLQLLPHLVNGVSLGLLFALIALGFMLIVGVMETINLAHGSLFALGMYVALFFISPQLGWFPDLQAWYMALPIGTRYLRRPVPRAGVRRAVRHAAGAVHAPHLRARPALRPAADLRRGAGDRGKHPPGLGLQRKAAAAAARRSPAPSCWAT